MALDKEKILGLAQKYILKGQSEKAIAEYIKLIEADPKDKRLYLKLGDLYYKNGENEKAIKEYLKLAALYVEEDLNFRAISIYKKILSIQPRHIETLYQIGKLYLKEGLAGSAKSFYQSVLEIKPGDQEALKALGGIEIQHQPKEIPKTTMSAPERFVPHYPPPSGIKPVDDKSDLFPTSAVETEVLSVEMEPPPPDKDSEMHYHLGIAYKEMELFDYAISELELAASDPEIKFDCYIMLGSCFLEKGDNTQAIQLFKEAAQIKGLTKEKLARLHFNLGLAYEANGMLSEAIETFNLVLSLDHSFSEARERIRRLQQLQK